MTQVLRIKGGTPLTGTIRISGAKNAALPLMCVSLLSDKPVTLKNVPALSDIHSMAALLEQHGVMIDRSVTGVYTFNAKAITNTTAPYELVSKMRASILVLGPLLARMGHAKVSLPGGCSIGTRPVDIHLSGLRALGAEIDIAGGYIQAQALKGLVGADITMPLVSVTATENLMMAASLAKGTTRLINAAREPEIVDLAVCLQKMGVSIEGAGTDTITIIGRDTLEPVEHHVMPDRIEMGTYIMAGLITGGKLTIDHGDISLQPAVTSVLQQAGALFTVSENNKTFRVERKEGLLKGTDVMTEPFPGFATDLQAQFMGLMSVADGAAMITETIFENRFMHVPELCRMGANITVHGASALVRGVKELSGAPVMATDLRASVCLVLAALAAKGETTISRLYHLDRGYEALEEKLRACGAVIERC